MSDFEDLKLDRERFNELESLLYANIHYNDAFGEQFVAVDQGNMGAESMPPTLQQQVQAERIVSDTHVINKQPARAPKLRYWDQQATGPQHNNNLNRAGMDISTKSTATNAASAAAKENANQAKSMPPPAAKSNSKQKRLMPKKKNTNSQKKPQHQMLQAKKQQVQKPKPQQVSKPHPNDEPERFDQRLLVAIPPKPPPNRLKPENIGTGPFGKATRKLDQLQRMAQKKQKSKQVRANRKMQQQKQQQKEPVQIINLAENENSSIDGDDDDVIHVPLPAPLIIDVDASEEEGQTQTYMEENAMDAADVKLGVACEAEALVTPPQYSPSNSVMSSDDFIVQKDTSRLLAEHARSTDEDLLVLTENAMSLHNKEQGSADQPQQLNADSSSEYEFVPPSRLEQIKQNFRVDEQQFRALDVYESESDITESGIYTKGKQKPTIIRNIDSESDSTDVELVVEPSVNKTKRLRKRRSSSNNQSQSEPNNDTDDDDDDIDTDSGDGVQATGVPGIARGMAVERCKRKIRRLSLRRNSEGANTSSKPKTRNSCKENGEDEGSETGSESEQALPSARDIAERLLQQKQQQQQQSVNANQQDEVLSVGSDVDTGDEAELRDAMSERITAAFERIDAHAREATRKLQGEIVPDQVSEEERTSDKEAIAEDYSGMANNDEELEQYPHNIQALEADPPEVRSGDLVGWNEEMRCFYNDSWRGEHFNVLKLQKAMSHERRHWRINNEDRFPVMRPRAKGKCTNCYDMGHVRSKCPRPRKPLVCSMCGIEGHGEPRCPNAICLGCGSKQAIYLQKCNKCSFHSRLICQLCKMRGHSTDLCPDKWRRYHSTTRANAELESKVQYRPKHCSYCGARGHLFENCRGRLGEYRNTNFTSTIVSHQKVYKDRSGPVSYPTDHSSLFAQDTPFHFEWTNSISNNSYYARFLHAVGLGDMQNRKHKATTMLQEVQQNMYSTQYVPNPLARMPISRKPAAPTESIIGEDVEQSNTGAPEAGLIQQEEISSNFQAVSSTPTAAAKPAKAKANQTMPLATHDLDSDSNYSFSDHFELPTSTTNESSALVTKSGPMDALPDIIPLSSSKDAEQDTSNSGINNVGISMCVNNKVACNSSSYDDGVEAESNCLPDVPCEGKILMARDQSEYLFSPEGRRFLNESAKECNVSVRMDFREYGYVLVIYGLKKHQEDLQLMLLRRNQDVKRKTTEFQGQKPPKRVDVLIRFIRDGINSLSGHLGNAHHLYQRVLMLEKMNTKNGYKTAERNRRQLNMILLGQAGLLNGNMHLDQLLLILKRLVEHHTPDENATPAMRKEIEEHWRMIFSPYPHDNYESLLQTYGKLTLKNRLSQLGIDPVLLGREPLTTKRERTPPPPPPLLGKQPSTNKRVRMPPPPPPPVWMQESVTATPMQPQQQNCKRPQKQRPLPYAKPQQANQQQQQQPTLNLARRGQMTQQQQLQPPFNNPLQRARFNLQQLNNLRPECAKLLEEMDAQDSRSSIDTDAKKPSMFWSRESLKYLDDLFKMTSNPDTVMRLQRVLQRSQRGELSHNDYRAVIRLHSLINSN